MFRIKNSNSSLDEEIKILQRNMEYNTSDVYISISGDKCISKTDLFETIKNSLNFPEYFSSNWDSFNDCIFDFIMRTEENILIYFSKMKILLSENEHDREIFLEIIKDLELNEYSKKVTIIFSD